MDFTHHVSDAAVPSLEAARLAHNAQPVSDPNAAPGALVPQLASVAELLAHQVDRYVRDCVKQFGLLPPPAPTEPAWHVVTRKQGLKALARANDPDVGHTAPVYEADVQARINAMPETTAEEKLAKYDTDVEFRTALTWRRGNPFFEQMVVVMGFTPAQRDALLQKAATFQE